MDYGGNEAGVGGAGIRSTSHRFPIEPVTRVQRGSSSFPPPVMSLTSGLPRTTKVKRALADAMHAE